MFDNQKPKLISHLGTVHEEDFTRIKYFSLDLLLEFIMIEHKCHFCDKCYGENIFSKHLSQRLHLENLLKMQHNT